MRESELSPSEVERARRRDRKRVTRMVVDGGNIRRQVEALRGRWWRARKAREQGPSNPPR